jgi:hypothetical protein
MYGLIDRNARALARIAINEKILCWLILTGNRLFAFRKSLLYFPYNYVLKE